MNDHIQVGAFSVVVELDSDGPSVAPRHEENLGTFYVHKPSRSYVSPDSANDDGLTWRQYQQSAAYQDANTYEAQLAAMIAMHRRAGAVVIPVAFDYEGGMTECDESYADGYYYASRDQIVRHFPRDIVAVAATDGGPPKTYRTVPYKRLPARVRGLAESTMRQEIRDYCAWTRGEVYGYVIRDDTDEIVGSRWGYVGDPAYALAAGREEAEAFEQERQHNVSLETAAAAPYRAA